MIIVFSLTKLLQYGPIHGPITYSLLHIEVKRIKRQSDTVVRTKKDFFSNLA